MIASMPGVARHAPSRRAIGGRACRWLATAVALSAAARAWAEPVNLGERALLAQSAAGAVPLAPPANAQFNSNFLSGQARRIDLSAFSNGNPMAAGIYRVDLYVNGAWQGRHDVAFKADANGQVDACFSPLQLEELGVDSTVLGAGTAAAVPLDDACMPVRQRIADAFGRFDSADLRYDLSIPQAVLRREARGYVSPAQWDRGINAGFIGYSFNGVDSDNRTPGGQRSRSAYLGLNAGVNLAGWQFRHDANLTWNEGDGRHWQGIASYAQRGIAGVRGLLTIGQSYTNGELFDAIGYSGISLVSDDRMLPDSLRGYAPVVRGIAETNARVEIRQNQQLIHSATVSPGSFVIDDLYPTGYGGDLEVTILEADGRRRVFKVPFGSVPQMLRAGISRYAITAGKVRNEQLDDAPWLLQATYQRGMGNRLTLYGGGNASEGYASVLYGLGLSTAVGAFAADVTHARTEQAGLRRRQGASVRLSYSHLIGDTGTNLTVAAYRYSTRGFYSLLDAMQVRDAVRRGDGFALGRQRSQVQLTLNQPLGQRWGALYVTGSLRDFYDRAGTGKQFQVGYNHAWRALNYGFSAVRTEDGVAGRPDTEYLLSVSVPLGRGTQPLSLNVDVGARGTQGYDNSRIGITGATGEANALSYGLALSDARDGDSTLVGNAEYRSRYTALSGSYSYSSAFRQAAFGANGSLVVHPGGATFTPDRGDTMVLVEARDARDARVGNAPGLRIDGDGYAVVPYVSPYRLNTVTLDPQGMSLDVELQGSSQTVAPYAGAISHLHFATRKGRALLMRVRDGHGQAMPFGAQVVDAAGQPVGMVSQGGRIYLRSEHDAGRLQVRWGANDDQHCGVDYQVPAEASAGQAGVVSMEAICR